MTEVFDFRFDASFRAPLAMFGITPERCAVRLEAGDLEVDFGPFHVSTPWANVAGAEVSGPYRAYRVIGPRLSLADRGATFGSAAAAGVCLRFRTPVAGLFGPIPLRHPGLTVTVATPEELVTAIRARIAPT